MRADLLQKFEGGTEGTANDALSGKDGPKVSV